MCIAFVYSWALLSVPSFQSSPMSSVVSSSLLSVHLALCATVLFLSLFVSSPQATVALLCMACTAMHGMQR